VPFCEGPNEKPEGFAKQKQSAIFAMRHASQLVVHHPSLIYNVPVIIATLLRHIRQTTRSVSVHPNDIPHFATFNHIQNIAHFTIHKVSLQTLRVTRHRKLALFSASHFAFEYVSQTSSQIFTKLSGGGRIASCDVR
jgi:hypothetical protein